MYLLNDAMSEFNILVALAECEESCVHSKVYPLVTELTRIQFPLRLSRIMERVTDVVCAFFRSETRFREKRKVLRTIVKWFEQQDEQYPARTDVNILSNECIHKLLKATRAFPKDLLLVHKLHLMHVCCEDKSSAEALLAYENWIKCNYGLAKRVFSMDYPTGSDWPSYLVDLPDDDPFPLVRYYFLVAQVFFFQSHMNEKEFVIQMLSQGVHLSYRAEQFPIVARKRLKQDLFALRVKMRSLLARVHLSSRRFPEVISQLSNSASEQLLHFVPYSRADEFSVYLAELSTRPYDLCVERCDVHLSLRSVCRPYRYADVLSYLISRAFLAKAAGNRDEGKLWIDLAETYYIDLPREAEDAGVCVDYPLPLLTAHDAIVAYKRDVF
jgi:hypothetical protein